MDIAYVSRSQFLDACEAALREHCAALDAGGLVHVALEKGGYDGAVIVTIRPDDRTFFGADWEGPDASRFPARIKAAATALLNCRCEGRFEVSHRGGALTIRRVAAEVDAESRSSTVYLISCVKLKREQACAARDLYVSDWFLKARRYAEASGCSWFILSAEYGLVAPDQVIAPYERTLNTMPVAERRIWAERVSGQLATAVPDVSHVVFLARERYREFLSQNLKDHHIKVSVPMSGLGIGEQLRWLKQRSSLPSE